MANGKAVFERKHNPTPRLQQPINRISQLPKPKQRCVMEMLDTVLAQASQASQASGAAPLAR